MAKEVESTNPCSNERNYTYSRKEIEECQFQSWYNRFRKSKDHDSINKMNSTPRSIIIPLSQKFIEYLLSDGVHLPIDATHVSSCVDAVIEKQDEDSWNDSSEEENGEENLFFFPQLTESITQAISKLGGSVFPKLNWSSPKDASWMNGGSLKCKTAGDVYLLLKSSDFIVHDLIHAWDNLNDDDLDRSEASSSLISSIVNKEYENEYFLILRKWCNFHRSMEFRCFVTSHQLVAISQREHTQCYPHLQSQQLQIRQYINEFFTSKVQYNFADGLIERYVFDCYIDKDDRVWIIDFNLWGTRTDSLLFTWNEVEKISDDPDTDITDKSNPKSIPEIRVVNGKNEVHNDPLASYRAPIDTVDLAKDVFGSQSFVEFMSNCEKPPALDKQS